MDLVIVESPTKAKTIGKFLGAGYKVESSYGHVRDLPKSALGIDVERDFEPRYIVPVKARKRVTELKNQAFKSAKVVLATDEDREGEAIAWHLVQALGLTGESQKAKSKYSGDKTSAAAAPKIERIVFHEITKPAIEAALTSPRELNMNLVSAQQARRVLDRLVGYELSPFLWKKIRKGLSAGRVQSVALRFIVEREREIEKFVPQEYWTIEAELKTESGEIFSAHLYKTDGKTVEKLAIKNEAEAEKIIGEIKKEKLIVIKVDRKEVLKTPPPPFTTSTLQQDAWNKFKYSAKQTMMLAQQLYENGFITYMRTDSLNLSTEAVSAAKNFLAADFGERYALETPRFYKTRAKHVQEAHEAVRPTDVFKTPEKLKSRLESRQLKIYELIWRRFLATQMPAAVYDSTAVQIQAGRHILKAAGSILKFDGFLKILNQKANELQIPLLKEGEAVKTEKVGGEQHFTEPPPRFNDASLVKALEERGIGRPSTYAPILATILERGYVVKDEQKRFKPTEIGILVNDMLTEHFPEVVDFRFTADIEEKLDEIAEGRTQWAPIVKNFYEPFKKHLTSKYELVKKVEEQTGRTCPEDGGELVVKFGRFGKFIACKNYPECKYTEPIEEEKEVHERHAGVKCELCGAPMEVKRSRFGIFLGCSRYPECKGVKKIEKGTGVACPKCQKGEIVERRSKRGRIFYGCGAYPQCDFALWSRPATDEKGEAQKCPLCQSLMIQNKNGLVCSNKDCFKKESPEASGPREQKRKRVVRKRPASA